MPTPSAKVIAVVRGGQPNPKELSGLAGTIRYLPIDGEPGSDTTVQAVYCLWPKDLRNVTLTWADAAYLVDERRQWGDGEHGGVTRVSFLQAASGLTRQEFGDHWRDVHTPLARQHHPTLWRYVQNVVVDVLTPGAPEVDGIAELSFRSVSDLRDRMYASEEGRQAVGADVRTFIDVKAGWRVLCQEDSNSNTF
jgi:uncharacterized protein (TIGR02118 family)